MPQIQVFRCPSCGASLSYEGGPETSLICQFCGTNVIIPPELQAQAEPPSTMPPLVPDATAPAAPISPEGMAAVEQLARDGKKIEAIKVYRQLTGVGLKEAKDAVEAIEVGGTPPPTVTPAQASQADLAAVAQLARAGQKLEAIKAYREATGASLREAVDAVESMMGGGGPSSNAAPGPRGRPAPKKRDNNVGCVGCVLALAALIAGFYFLFFYLPIRISGAYGAAVAAARSNPDIVEALGRPVDPDWWLGVTRISCGSSCSARFSMGFHGSHASGTVSIYASMRSGGNYFNAADWSVSGAVATKLGKYDLSGRSTTSVPQATAAPAPTMAPGSTVEPVAPKTPTPDIDATADVMQRAQRAWQPTSPITLAEPFKDWPLGLRQDDAIAVTTTTQAQSYLMTVFPNHSSSYMNFAPPEAPAVQDFVAMVDLKFIYGGAANTYAYGLVFRLLKDDYGFFGLQNDGKFKVLLVQDTGIYEQVIAPSTAIRTNPGSTNHLEVRNLGSDFVFEINSQRVWSLQQDLNPGVVGLGVDVRAKGKPAEVQFSKFSVFVPGP
jgi:ribosomal protein L7/L12